MPVPPDPHRLGIVQDSPLRRVVDVAVGCAGLLLVGWLMLLLGLTVRGTSPGPALFRQPRVGRNGRSFTIVKFRTMVDGAATNGCAVSGHADARITRVGRLLRDTRLDELPQLLNVVRGDMTLIGPRPEAPRFLAYYTEEERQLLLVRPGVIGPGAVLFARQQAGQLDGVEDPERFYLDHHLHPKLALDLEYLRDRRLARDLRILSAAVAAVTTGTAAGRRAQPVPAGAR